MKLFLFAFLFFISFFEISSAQTHINEYEYWFDNDYAGVVATSISPVTNFTLNQGISTGSLSVGLHTFHIRFKDDNNNYSSVQSQYIANFASGGNTITNYEYWFDANYAGHVSGTVTAKTNVQLIKGLSTAGLSNGFHSFHIRFQDVSGNWGSVLSQFITNFTSNSSKSTITNYEYWFDANYAAHISGTVTAKSNVEIIKDLGTAGLSSGFHSFHVRFQDSSGIWGSVLSQFFNNSANNTGLPNVVNAYRYYFDNNFANLTTQNISTSVNPYDLITSINCNGLSKATHTIHIQFRDLGNNWSSMLTNTFTSSPSAINHATVNTINPFSGIKNLLDRDSNLPANTVKICADGSQVTTLIYTNNDASVTTGNIKFWLKSDPYGNDVDQYGYFINYQYSGNTVTATLAHPKYLKSNYLPYRNDSILIVDYTNSTIAKYKIPINVYRAPVLFIHGYNSNSGAFSTMQNDLLNSNYYPTQLTNLENYSKTCNQSFSTNVDKVMQGINQNFQQAYTSSYSTGKVDIVSHSMGGILARLYIQNDYGYTYRNDVNKIITLNTPHSGSELANTMELNPLVWGICEFSPLLGANNLFCGGAGYDMTTYSYAINKVLNDPNSLSFGLPSHSITTYINDNDFNSCTVNLLQGFRYASLYFYISPLGVFGGSPNDGVVKVISQEGGLSGATTSNAGYGCHTGSPDNTSVISYTTQLLCDNPNGTDFESKGFNPISLGLEEAHRKIIPYYSFTSATIPASKIRTRSGSLLNIVKPATGTNVNQNQNLQVTIDFDSTINHLTVVIGNQTLGITVIDTAVTSSSINLNYFVPSNAIGPIEIDAIGFDSLNIIASDSNLFFATTLATLDSVRINPNSILVPTKNNSNFQLIGHYSDGNSVDITSLPGVKYSVLNPTVANIIGNNKVEGLTVDSTFFVASYQGISDTIPVYVYLGDTISRPLFTSNTNLICAGSGNAQFTNYTTGHPKSILWLFPGGTPLTSTDSLPLINYQNVGSYDVSLIAYYSYKTDTLKLPEFINVGNTPEPSVNSFGDTLSCSISNGTAYLWYRNGVPLLHDTTSILITDTAAKYFVDVMNQTGCVGRSDTLNFVPTGISEVHPMAFYLKPNPNNGTFEIHFINPINNIQLQIFNSIGQQVYTQSLLDEKKSLNISLGDLPEGIYFIQVFAKKGVLTNKFVIAK